MKRNSFLIILLCLVLLNSCSQHETYDPVTAHISFVNYTDTDFDSLQLEYRGFPISAGYKIQKVYNLNVWDTTEYITCDSIDEGFELMLYSDTLAFFDRWDYPKKMNDPSNPQVNHFIFGYYHFGIFPADSLNSDIHIGLEFHTFDTVY